MRMNDNDSRRTRNHLRNEEGLHKRRVRISKEPEERRQEIIETALAVFSEKGFDNTTIQDIVDRMGVSPGLCYRYFRSKSEIFAAASEYYAKKAVEQIEIPEERMGSAIDKFNLQVKQMLEYTIKNAEFEANYNEDPLVRASRLDDVADEMSEKMIPIIKQGVEEGVFHCEYPENSTRFLICGIIHTFHSGMTKKNFREYIVSFVDFFKLISIRVLEPEEINKIGENWQF